MGFFIVIMGFVILVVVMNILKKESPTNDRSARSHSSTHSIDHSATSTFVSIENLDTHNCADNASSFADKSSCSDSGSSSD